MLSTFTVLKFLRIVRVGQYLSDRRNVLMCVSNLLAFSDKFYVACFCTWVFPFGVCLHYFVVHPVCHTAPHTTRRLNYRIYHALALAVQLQIDMFMFVIRYFMLRPPMYTKCAPNNISTHAAVSDPHCLIST